MGGDRAKVALLWAAVLVGAAVLVAGVILGARAVGGADRAEEVLGCLVRQLEGRAGALRALVGVLARPDSVVFFHATAETDLEAVEGLREVQENRCVRVAQQSNHFAVALGVTSGAQMASIPTWLPRRQPCLRGCGHRRCCCGAKGCRSPGLAWSQPRSSRQTRLWKLTPKPGALLEQPCDHRQRGQALEACPSGPQR